MADESEYIDLVCLFTTSSVVFPECSFFVVSLRGDVGYILSLVSFVCFIVITTSNVDSLLFPFFRFCCQVFHLILLSWVLFPVAIMLWLNVIVSPIIMTLCLMIY